MQLDLRPAEAFGRLLRENPAAANYYDGCSMAQKQKILLRLGDVKDMDAFVRQLSNSTISQ